MKIRFKRVLGEFFDWYGVDITGSIALFASGFAAVPKSVFDDRESYFKTKEYFDNLPKFTKGRLSKWFEDRKDEFRNGFATPISEAERGIYSFYDKYYTDVYELISVPDKEIKFSNLPDEIQTFLLPTAFNEIVFCETKEFNVEDFFECVND